MRPFCHAPRSFFQTAPFSGRRRLRLDSTASRWSGCGFIVYLRQLIQQYSQQISFRGGLFPGGFSNFKPKVTICGHVCSLFYADITTTQVVCLHNPPNGLTCLSSFGAHLIWGGWLNPFSRGWTSLIGYDAISILWVSWIQTKLIPIIFPSYSTFSPFVSELKTYLFRKSYPLPVLPYSLLLSIGLLISWF